ncbi:MAG: hypothetical protein ABIG44_00145 [Planctomycetota bacterium]
MKHSRTIRIIWVMGALLLGASLGGCPVDLNTLEPPPAAAGQYWIEYTDGELALYRLPDQRGEEGVWYVIETESPEWFTGPAVYELDTEGLWTRLTEDENLTLDEVIQLYDTAPAVPDNAG